MVAAGYLQGRTAIAKGFQKKVFFAESFCPLASSSTDSQPASEGGGDNGACK
jgi:hypothetical protein